MRRLPITGASSYEISDDGTVTNRATGYRLKPFLDDSGYPLVKIRTDDGSKKTLKVHRLVANAFIPNPDNKPCVNQSISTERTPLSII